MIIYYPETSRKGACIIREIQPVRAWKSGGLLFLSRFAEGAAETCLKFDQLYKSPDAVIRYWYHEPVTMNDRYTVFDVLAGVKA